MPPFRIQRQNTQNEQTVAINQANWIISVPIQGQFQYKLNKNVNQLPLQELYEMIRIEVVFGYFFPGIFFIVLV